MLAYYKALHDRAWIENILEVIHRKYEIMVKKLFLVTVFGFTRICGGKAYEKSPKFEGFSY